MSTRLAYRASGACGFEEPQPILRLSIDGVCVSGRVWVANQSIRTLRDRILGI